MSDTNTGLPYGGEPDLSPLMGDARGEVVNFGGQNRAAQGERGIARAIKDSIKGLRERTSLWQKDAESKRKAAEATERLVKAERELAQIRKGGTHTTSGAGNRINIGGFPTIPAPAERGGRGSAGEIRDAQFTGSEAFRYASTSTFSPTGGNGGGIRFSGAGIDDHTAEEVRRSAGPVGRGDGGDGAGNGGAGAGGGLLGGAGFGRRAFYTAAGSVGVAAGAYLGRNEQEVRERSLLYNQLAIGMSNGGQYQSGLRNVAQAVTNQAEFRAGTMGGTDYINAVTGLRNVAGSDPRSTSFQSGLRALGQVATLMPGVGSQGGLTVQQQLQSAEVGNRLAGRGILVSPGGRQRDPLDVFEQVSQQFYGRRGGLTRERANAIQERGTNAYTEAAFYLGEGELLTAYQEYAQVYATLGRAPRNRDEIQSITGDNAVWSQANRAAGTEARRAVTGLDEAQVLSAWDDTAREMNKVALHLLETSNIMREIFAGGTAGVGRVGGGLSQGLGFIDDLLLLKLLSKGGGGGGTLAKAAGLASRALPIAGGTVTAGAAGFQAHREGFSWGRLAAGIGGGATAGAAIGAATTAGPGAIPGAIIGGIVGGIGVGIGSATHGEDEGDPPELIGSDPRLKSGLQAMMRDNPRLKLNSGKRSHAEQEGMGNGVPAGKSRHVRGTAADVGPRSEYGWIAANAKKYGLETVTPGEPWHLEVAGTRDPYSKYRSRQLEQYGSEAGGGLGKLNPGEAGSQPHVIQAMRFINRRWPNNRGLGGYRTSARDKSGHPAGRAIDAMVAPGNTVARGADKQMGDEIAQWFLDNPDVFGTEYAIWFQRIANPGGEWRGMEDRGSNTQNHMDHPHLNFRASHDVDMSMIGETGETGSSNEGGGGTGVGQNRSATGSYYGSVEGSAEIRALAGADVGEGGTGRARRSGSGSSQDGTAGSGTADVSGAMPSGEGWGVIEAAAKKAGMSGRHLETMMAIAFAESGGGDPRAHNDTPPDNSYGLWQINMYGNLGPARRKDWGLKSNEELFDPVLNAKMAQKIYRAAGNYTPWSVYTSGKYREHLDDAKAHAATPEFGGALEGQPDKGDPPEFVDMPLGTIRAPSGAGPAEGTLSTLTSGEIIGAPTMYGSRRQAGSTGGGGRVIQIDKLEMKVTLANGSRREVEKLFDQIEDVADERRRVRKLQETG